MKKTQISFRQKTKINQKVKFESRQDDFKYLHNL